MKKVLLLISALMMAVSAMAQTGVASGTPFGHGNDSIECQKNIAFYKTYAKSENYVDAYTFWKRVYDNCPGASKDTYIIGADIIKWHLEKAETAEERQEWLDRLMSMYDTRIKYFGNDPDTGTDFILGSKAADYINYMGENADYLMIYDWLKPAVEDKKVETDPLTLSLFTYASMVKMFHDPDHKEQYVKEHLAVDGYYKVKMDEAKNAGDEATAKMYEGYMVAGENAFAASGAADCELMEKIYGPQVDEHATDKEFLTNVLVLFQSVNCVETPAYYAASEYMYRIEPTAKAALGIAGKAYKEKNYDRATQYYQEAINLSDDATDKGNAYYLLAVIAYERGNYSSARANANKAMQERSNFGAPMLLIANMYAASAPSIYPDDPIKQRIVYCLVVDKCQQARSIDPSISNEANSLIGRYSQYYPAKEDIFMHPDLHEGESFTIGGWINETTTIRTN